MEPDPHKFEYKQIRTLSKPDCLDKSVEQVVRPVSMEKEEYSEVVVAGF